MILSFILVKFVVTMRASSDLSDPAEAVHAERSVSRIKLKQR
jgi:hypothetical protein